MFVKICLEASQLKYIKISKYNILVSLCLVCQVVFKTGSAVKCL